MARVAMAALLLAAPGLSAQDGAMTEDEKIVHLLNRFTPGATADLVREVKAAGRREWFAKQLAGDVVESEALTRVLAKYETLGLSNAEIFEKYNDRIPKDATPAEKREIRRRAAIPMREMLEWVGLRAVYSSHAVRETSGDFFRNHFSVSIDKGELRSLTTEWERDVIAKHALGNFGTLLEATAKHPAMLFYLDNHLSRRPPTEAELRILEARERRRSGSEERAAEAVEIARQRGLNENYARELLELHTLGVDHGYTQEDIVQLAKILTGWTIGRLGDGRGKFEFNRRMHCPGDKTFLGETIREGGVAEGERVLEILRRHPTTARFLAWKLCRWFVNDEPSEAMVRRVADVFQKSEGDLPKVYAAIADDPEFFARANFRAKFKRPWEFVVSALRATGADVSDATALYPILTGMNEPLYRCADPTGYYDQAEAWCDPGAMAARWTFASDLANGRVRGVRIPASLYADLPAAKPKEWRDALAAKLLPVAGVGRRTAAEIDRIVDAELAKNPKAGPEKVGPAIVAALLGSPEFQRQ
jgi:uncharacterized protein (DUF1800 family)